MGVEFKDLAPKKRKGKDCKQTWYKTVHVYGMYSNFLLFDFSNCKIYNEVGAILHFLSVDAQ